MEWEEITPYEHRARVPGGWVLKVTQDVMTNIRPEECPHEGYEWRTSICFIPDPNHKWTLK